MEISVLKIVPIIILSANEISLLKQIIDEI